MHRVIAYFIFKYEPSALESTIMNEINNDYVTRRMFLILSA